MRTLRAVVAVLVTIVAVLLFVAVSETGLRWVVQSAGGVLPGRLQVGNVAGRLLGPLHLSAVSYHSEQLTLEITQLDMHWQPRRLLSGVLAVSALKIDGVSVVLADTDAGAPPPVASTPRTLPDVDLPLALEIGGVHITQLRLPHTQLPLVERLELDLQANRDDIRIERLTVESAGVVGSVAGRVVPRSDYPLGLALNWQRAPGKTGSVTALQGSAQLSGTVRELSVQQELVVGPPVESLDRSGLKIDGTVKDLLNTPEWQMQLAVHSLNPHEVQPAWPALTLDGELHASGNLTQARVDADLSAIFPQMGEVVSGLELNWRQGDTTTVALTARHSESGAQSRVTASIEGFAASDGGTNGLVIRAGGDWQDLAWPLVGVPTVRSPQGQFSLDGTPDDYQLTIDAVVQQGALPAGALKLQANGNRQQLTVESFSIAALEGELLGRGEVAWAPQLAWRFDLSGKALNPGSIAPEWPGKIGLAAQLRGGVNDTTTHSQINVERLDGQLRGYPVRASGTVNQRGTDFSFAQVNVTSGAAALVVDGEVAAQWNLRWNLQADDLAALWPGSKGRVSAQGTLAGLRATPRIAHTLTALGIGLGTYRVARLESRGDVDLAPGGRIDLSLAARDIALPERTIDALSLDGAGTLEAHNVTVRGESSDLQLVLAIAAGLSKAREWRGQLLRADLLGDTLGNWGLVVPGAFVIGGGKSALGQWCWRQRDALLCAQAQQRDGVWSGNLSGQGLPLDALRAAIGADAELRPAAITGTVALRASGSYDPARGTALLAAQADTSSGAVRFAESARADDLIFDPGQLEVRLDAEGLTGALHIPLSTEGRVDATAQLPGWSPAVPMAEQSIVADLRAQVNSLARFDALLPALDIISGQLRAQLAITGTVASPLFSGVAELTDGAAGIPALGLDIKDASIQVRGNQTNELLLKAQLRSGKGILRLEGHTLLDRAQGWPTDLVISGEDVEAVDVPQVRVLVSPQLNVSVRERVLRVDGEVLVPMARIAPRQLPEGSIAPSRDVEIVSAADASPGFAQRWQMYTDVGVALGERIRFDGFGLRGKFAGDIRVIDAPGKLTTARGELRVVDGVYQAYGQDLSIERGRLVFADSLLDDPGLDVNAMRKVDDVVAGVRVRGTLQDPLLSVYSRPAMGEADTLSYLLFGRPARATSAGESNQLLSAVQSMGLSKGEDIAKRIGTSVGLDEIRVDAQNGLQEAALVMGRYLSPKLYLRYVAGLFSASNVVQIQYLINKSLQVQTETGDRTGVDVFYTIER